MINILLLLLEPDLELLLLLLQLQHLKVKDFLGVKSTQLLSSQPLDNLSSNLGLGQRVDLVHSITCLLGLELILLSLNLSLISFFLETLIFHLLLLLPLTSLLDVLLFLLGIVLLLQHFLSFLNDLVTLKQTNMVTSLALMISISNLVSQLPDLLLVSSRSDDGHALVKHGHHGHQLGPHLFTGHGLDCWTFRNLGSLSFTQICSEVDSSSSMVNADLHVVVPGAFNNQPLHVMMG